MADLTVFYGQPEVDFHFRFSKFNSACQSVLMYQISSF